MSEIKCGRYSLRINWMSPDSRPFCMWLCYFSLLHFPRPHITFTNTRGRSKPKCWEKSFRYDDISEIWSQSVHVMISRVYKIISVNQKGFLKKYDVNCFLNNVQRNCTSGPGGIPWDNKLFHLSTCVLRAKIFLWKVDWSWKEGMEEKESSRNQNRLIHF